MIKFETTQNQIQAQTPSYIWRWEAETDTLSILDAQNRLISKSKHQPQILPSDFQSATPTYEIKDNTICIYLPFDKERFILSCNLVLPFNIYFTTTV